MKNLFLISLIVGLSAFAGCVDAADQRRELATQIDQMTQDLSCDEASQCKVFGFGDKPCGGYNTYRVYSTKTTDETLLLEKAARYLELDKAHNQQIGMGSTCDVVMPPGTVCQTGQCVAVPGNSELQ